MGAPSLIQERSTAFISPCGRYRYQLTRTWDPAQRRIAFVMLNPSTADALTNDATIRRCIGFATRWGYGSLEVLNLFAFRSTSPKMLTVVPDPIGPDNIVHLLHRVSAPEIAMAVVAWGCVPTPLAETANTLKRGIYRVRETWCLGITAMGHPKHPVRLANDTPLQRFRDRE